MNHLLSSAQRSQGQKAAILTQLPAATIIYILVGPMMMLYTNDVLGYSANQIAGLLSVIPLVCIPSIFLQNKIIAKGKVKALFFGDCLRLVIVTIFLFLPQTWISYPVLMGILISHTLVQNIGTSVWQPILRDITTTQDRGRFFSNMRLAFTFISLLTSAAIPIFMGSSITNFQYKCLLAFVALGMINRLVWSRKIPEILPEPSQLHHDGGTLKQIILICRRSTLLRKPLVIIILLMFQTYPLYVVYLKKVLNLSSSHVTMITLTQTIGSVFALFILGRVIDLIGHQPVLKGLLILAIIFAPLHLLVPLSPSEGRAFLGMSFSIYLLMFINLFIGFTLAGLGLTSTSIEHVSTSDLNPTLEMNLFRVTNLIISSLYMSFNGFLIEYTQSTSFIEMSSFIDFSPFIEMSSTNLSIDPFKFYMVSTGILIPIIVIYLARHVENTREGFGVSSFFNSLSPSSFRHFFASNVIHQERREKRVKTARWLGNQTTTSSIDTLIKLLDDPSYDVKVESIRSLAHSASGKAGVTLLQMLDDPQNRYLADHLCWALGKLQRKEAVSSIIFHCHHKYPPRLRAMACRALGELNEKRAIAVLYNILSDTQTYTSSSLLSAACGAMIRLGAKEHAELLFDTISKTETSNDRYELLELMANWLKIPSAWILRSSSKHSTWTALNEDIQFQNLEWQKKNLQTIEIFQQRQLNALKDHFPIFISESSPSVNAEMSHLWSALDHTLQKLDQWQPIAVMCCATMLHGSRTNT